MPSVGSSSGEVTAIVVEDRIGQITFSHPKANCLTRSIMRELRAGIEQFSNDSEIGVVLLRSGGDSAFCGGVSLKELDAAATVVEREELFAEIAQLLLAMRSCKKFIVASVQGKAVGGGVGIIAAADYVFAASSSSIRLPELAYGFGPFVIGPAIERKIGAAQFAALSIDTGWRESSWSLSRGLFNRVGDSVEILNQELMRLCRELATADPQAATELRSCCWRDTEEWIGELPRRAKLSAQYFQRRRRERADS